MKKTDELKPCPFCGGKAELRCIMDIYWIKCTKCYANTVGKSGIGQSIESWNQRSNNEENN